MKDDILQMPRDAYPAPHAISDDDAEGREDTGAEKLKICRPLDIRSKRPGEWPHGCAAGRGALYATTLSTQSTSAS